MRTAFRPAGAAALAALLLQSSLPPAALAAAPERPLTAILLVARARLPDPNFADSVVLVMNNLGPAPVGVIINRPTPVSVAQLFPDLKSLARLHDKVYFGGPIDMGSVWYLVRANAPPRHAIRTCQGVYLSADRELLLELLRREKPMEGLRIFVGHAGWAPGQLESEIGQKDWTLEHAAPAAIFGGKPDAPWPTPPSPAAPQS
ncbi:MAG TPA: YqgE/AlgH family protein [Steroidobacteraceae bacterium]|nr:YqgE/AlgH family protein [Steroidobacteraceae bacterium]